MKDVTGSSALWSFSKPCGSKGWASSSINQTSPSAYSLFYGSIVLRLQLWSKKQCVLSPFSSSSSWSSSSFIYFFILPLPSPLLPLPLAFSTWEPDHNVSARWRDPSLNGFRALLTLSYSPSSWKHQGFLQEISPSTCWYIFWAALCEFSSAPAISEMPLTCSKNPQSCYRCKRNVHQEVRGKKEMAHN